MGRYWSKEIIIASIKQLHQAGSRLNSNYVQQQIRRLYLAAYTYFGGWRQAIRASGLRYKDVRVSERPHPVWSKERIILTIQDLHRSGEKVNSNHIQLHRQPLYGAALKYFGSWKKAVNAAGLNYDKVRVYRPGQRWTKKKIIAVIRSRKRQKLPLNVAAIPSTIAHATSKVFGPRGWQKALRAVGIDPKSVDPKIKWTKKRVQREIRRLHGSGKPLNCLYLMRNYSALIGAGIKLFGSWQRAVKSAGLSYAQVRLVRMRWWTKKRVLCHIRQLAKFGAQLSLKEIRYGRHRDSLIMAAIKHFGSWSQAVEAAGFDYRLHAQTWSSKAWVRKLTPPDVKKLEHQVEQLTRKRGKNV